MKWGSMLVLFAVLAVGLYGQTAQAPGQPATGPGGSNYPYAYNLKGPYQANGSTGTPRTNVADEREYWTFHPALSKTIQWRVRAVRVHRPQLDGRYHGLIGGVPAQPQEDDARSIARPLRVPIRVDRIVCEACSVRAVCIGCPNAPELAVGQFPAVR